MYIYPVKKISNLKYLLTTEKKHVREINSLGKNV